MVVKQSVISQHNMDQWMDGRVLVLVNMLIVNTDKVQSFSHQSMHSQSFHSFRESRILECFYK